MSLQPQVTALAQAVGADVKALQTALVSKQATLVSGTSIKTVGGQSLLGAGDIPLPAGGGGSSGPSGAETITLSAVPVPGAYTQLTATKQHKTVLATVPGHTVRLPDATGLTQGAAVVVLHCPRYGVRICDAVGKTLLSEAPRSVIVCSLGAAGWALSVVAADSTTIAAGEPTVFASSAVNGNGMSMAAIDDARTMICWPYDSGTRCRIVKLLPDGSVVVGAPVNLGGWGNGGSFCAALSGTKAMVAIRTYPSATGGQHILTIADTEITAVSAMTVFIPDQIGSARMIAVDAGTVLVAWKQVSGGVHSTLAQCFGVTGTTVAAIGTPATLQTGSSDVGVSIAPMSAGKYAVAFTSTNLSSQIAMTMLTVSGTYDVTASAVASMGAGTAVTTEARRLDDTTAVLIFKTGYTNGPFYVMTASWNGTTFVPGMQILVESDAVLPFSLHSAGPGGFVLTYLERVTFRLLSRLVYMDRGVLSLGPITSVYPARTSAYVLGQVGETSTSLLMYRPNDALTTGLFSVLRNP